MAAGAGAHSVVTVDSGVCVVTLMHTSLMCLVVRAKFVLASTCTSFFCLFLQKMNYGHQSHASAISFAIFSNPTLSSSEKPAGARQSRSRTPTVIVS